MPTGGSGFLALDKNSDGEINNGNELFGPQNGNGFSELSKYDEDKNQWIDENDSIFNKLRIWTKDETGKESLFALGEKGIGAIFLGNVSTPFAINTPDNKQNAQLSQTGVVLKEDGTATTIQHLDFVV